MWPDDVYFGRRKEILEEKREPEQQPFAKQKAFNLGKEAVPLI
jgi:hypothetical protein